MRPDDLRPLFTLAPPHAASRRCSRGSVLNSADVLLLASAEERQGGAKLHCVSDLPMPKRDEVGATSPVSPHISLSATRWPPAAPRPRSPLYLPYISPHLPISPPYLPPQVGASRTEAQGSSVTMLELVGAVYAIAEEPPRSAEAALGVGRGGEPVTLPPTPTP